MKPYYDHAGITIYHERWQDILWRIPGVEAVDLVLTDPPYNTTQNEWDTENDWDRFFSHAFNLCDLFVMFSAQPFTTQLILSSQGAFRYEIVWNKPMPTGFFDANRRPLRAHENILVFSHHINATTYNPQMVPCAPRREHRATVRGTRSTHYGASGDYVDTERTSRYPKDVIDFSNGHGGKSDHPSQKPLDLMQWLVRTYSNPGDLILDPFCGSGKTLQAAKAEGRRAIGFDTSERFCEIAAKNVCQEVLAM